MDEVQRDVVTASLVPRGGEDLDGGGIARARGRLSPNDPLGRYAIRCNVLVHGARISGRRLTDGRSVPIQPRHRTTAVGLALRPSHQVDWCRLLRLAEGIGGRT